VNFRGERERRRLTPRPIRASSHHSPFSITILLLSLFFDCVNVSKIRHLKPGFAKSINDNKEDLDRVKGTFPDDATVRDIVFKVVAREVGNDRMLNEIDS
jgi:hypothetical protein